MKFLALLFLVGFASASFYDVLDQAADELTSDFLDKEHSQFLALRAAEDGQDLGTKLREALDKIIEKIKDALERGKTVKEEYLEKLQELREKLKEAKIDIGEKAKELLKKLRDRIKDYLKDLLDKLGKDKEERSADDYELQLAVRAFDLRDIFRKLKQALLDKIDGDALKAKIEELFGKGNEFIDQVFKIIKENGLEKAREKLLKLIDRILGDGEDRQERSLSEKWQKIKDFFEKVKIEIKERFLKFGDWVKEVMGEKLEKLKDKVARLKEIAKEIHEHGKELSKDVAVEALEFLRPYKEDLGTLWEQVKETVKEVLNRKD